ncbi:MAG: homoserine O-succinyltransferase [Parvularculaceae bacterium]
MRALAIADPEAGDCRTKPLIGARTAPSIAWRDVEIDLDDLALASGERLDDARLRLRLHGEADAPVVVASGGISAGRNVADAAGETGWWRDLANPGGAIDVSERQVIGFDFLPGDEREAKTITPADQARALALGFDALGVEAIHAFVGASYGGFVGLAFAALFPERLEKLCVISAALRPHPMSTALRGVQRRIILFARAAGREKEGVALARELAMTTYRSADELRARFSSDPLGSRAGDPYDVCAYLMARGRSYAEVMPAARYLTLSDSLDRADVDPNAVTAECLFIGARSDRLVPIADVEAAARAVAGRSQFLAIDSLVGHDAFLCDTPLFAGALEQFLERS